MKTYPQEKWYHTVLGWLLWPIMRLRANSKLSHWWHWLHINIDGEELERIGTLVLPDCNAARRYQNDKQSLIKASLGGWKKCVVLSPADDKLSLCWFLCFSSYEPTGLVQQRCTIQLEGRVKALIGPTTVTFFGMTCSGKYIKLVAEDTTTRDDLKWELIPLI